MMRPIAYMLALCALMALAFSLAPAQTVAPKASVLATPASAREVLERMAARNGALESYTARVHVKLRMLSFPYLAPSLDGTSYYKRPGKSEVVFDHVPGYAKGFQKLFNDVDDPNGWEKDENIALRGMGSLDGRPMIVLILTKKIHSDQIDHATVYVDPVTYELPQMEWHYTNGGTIVMKQYYQVENGFSVVARAHVDISYRVRAVGDAQYEPYRMNVPVADTVFTQ
ncbi:MAG TPA: hypothetical protein VNF68_12935 [Candidatus Baltobacteraceae bacterium]|nr:hypothetical protein [Candidatus Baltobacteraceae bacterium]